ncbi:hypothetical protein SAMN04489761_1884 [Tenacibaculum sp. MAR_2009_124]|uniref:DUF6268 family outer membrane beta-barrel protein n=1 Tax=Tenacibaculum sp. MAR_2009_124 TaxID=1250059 RepID=UPI0008968D97|nr:DUF6268 family outer membrane beta-barrel protein [Tenacibaculum sp. MAR_2009_124]SEB82540.1 hypothetical protein SAMN04489761_1884 [Tenacibaculum sp. MAR_2009_124]
MVRKTTTLILFLFIANIYGQVTGDVFVVNKDRDAFYVHYTPEVNNSDAFDYQRVSSKLSFPLMKKRLSLFNTIGMDYHSFSFGAQKQPSILDSREEYFNINYSLLANYKISKNWSLNALLMPHANGSFNRGLESDDFHFNGILFAEKRFTSKNKQNTYLLSFGVGYLTLSGEKRVNPVVNFMGSIGHKLTFAVGLPNTYVKYDFNRKHSIKVLGDLNDFSLQLTNERDNGQYANVSQSIFTTVSAGLEYNYWFSKSIGVLVRGTHSVFEKYEFQDSNEEVIYDMDIPLKAYISVGLKVNPFRGRKPRIQK